MKKQLAFPVCSVGGEFNVTHHGMTLRDYFAAQALPGLLHACPDYEALHEQLASFAYQIADSMLAERDKEQS